MSFFSTIHGLRIKNEYAILHVIKQITITTLSAVSLQDIIKLVVNNLTRQTNLCYIDIGDIKNGGKCLVIALLPLATVFVLKHIY